MKHFRLVSALLLLFALFAACSSAPQVMDIREKTFVCESGGFGSDFTIYFGDDGVFQYYEGALSSHIGMGNYAVDGDRVILTEIMQGKTCTFCFRIGIDDITYVKENSDRFMYLDIPDGTRFYHTENEPIFYFDWNL